MIATACDNDQPIDLSVGSSRNYDYQSVSQSCESKSLEPQSRIHDSHSQSQDFESETKTFHDVPSRIKDSQTEIKSSQSKDKDSESGIQNNPSKIQDSPSRIQDSQSRIQDSHSGNTDTQSAWVGSSNICQTPTVSTTTPPEVRENTRIPGPPIKRSYQEMITEDLQCFTPPSAGHPPTTRFTNGETRNKGSPMSPRNHKRAKLSIAYSPDRSNVIKLGPKRTNTNLISTFYENKNIKNSLADLQKEFEDKERLKNIVKQETDKKCKIHLIPDNGIRNSNLSPCEIRDTDTPMVKFERENKTRKPNTSNDSANHRYSSQTQADNQFASTSRYLSQSMYQDNIWPTVPTTSTTPVPQLDNTGSLFSIYFYMLLHSKTEEERRKLQTCSDINHFLQLRQEVRN